MSHAGLVAPSGTLGLTLLPPYPSDPTLGEIIEHGCAHAHVPREVAAWRARNFRNLMRGARRVLQARALGIPHHYGVLYLDLIRPTGRVRLGLASMRVVTDAGAEYLVDSLQGTTEPENLRYHGFGTGTTAEAASQTALVTELTTQYATDNTRPTGSQTEGANAKVFRTVATLSPDSGGTIAVTEHGVFSQAATGGGTMLDRSVFSAVNVVASSDSLQATYDFTINSGS